MGGAAFMRRATPGFSSWEEEAGLVPCPREMYDPREDKFIEVIDYRVKWGKDQGQLVSDLNSHKIAWLCSLVVSKVPPDEARFILDVLVEWGVRNMTEQRISQALSGDRVNDLHGDSGRWFGVMLGKAVRGVLTKSSATVMTREFGFLDDVPDIDFESLEA